MILFQKKEKKEKSVPLLLISDSTVSSLPVLIFTVAEDISRLSFLSNSFLG